MGIYRAIRSYIREHKTLDQIYTFFSVRLYGNILIIFKRYRLKKYASKLLTRFHKALSSAGCEFWLDYGTLLGAIRENGLIGHDLDMDTGMFIHNRNETMLHNLKNNGFKKVRQIEVDGILAEETYQYRGVNIDIFYYSQIDSEHIQCYLFNPVQGLTVNETIAKFGGLGTRTLTYKFDGLAKYAFLGVKVGIPINYDEYLINCYGPTYMVPDPNFKFSNSPNIRYLDNVWGKVTYYK